MDIFNGLALILQEENNLMPWKNGAGLTRQIAVFPSDANINNFICRISITEIKSDNVYSHFPHIHRTQMLLNGCGVELKFSNKVTILNKQYQLTNFSGNNAVSCHMLRGPCQVLNIMTRQGEEIPESWVIYGACNKMLNDKPRVFYIAQGEYDVAISAHKNITLRTGDALLVTADQFRFKSAATSNAVMIEIKLH